MNRLKKWLNSLQQKQGKIPSSTSPSSTHQFSTPQQNPSISNPADSPASSSQSQQPYQLHDSADTLTLDKFIQCLCDSDFKVLVISGQPPIAEIEKAWFGIYSRYIDLCQTSDLKYSLRLQNDMVVLGAQMERIKLALLYLAHMYDDEMVDALRGYGYNRQFKWEDQEAFQADLKYVSDRSKKLVLKYQIKEAELEAYKASAAGEAPDRVYFTKILMRLSDHAGYSLKPHELTVTEFAVRKQEYLDFLERHQKK